MSAIWLQVKTTDFALRVCEDKVSAKKMVSLFPSICLLLHYLFPKPALLYFSRVLNPRYDRQQVLTGWDFKILANRTHITIQMTSPPRENMVFTVM